MASNSPLSFSLSESPSPEAVPLLPTSSHSLLLPARSLMPGSSEDLQVCVRTPRAERVTTSCSECRRRKQKCDQGRPCSNCIKRFPQPSCEYKQNKRRNPALSHEPAFKVILPGQDYDYIKFNRAPAPSPMLSASLAFQQLQQQHNYRHHYQQQLPAQSLLPIPISQALPLSHHSPSLLSSSQLGASTLSLQNQQQQHQQQHWDLFAASALDTRWSEFDLIASADSAYGDLGSLTSTMNINGGGPSASSLLFGMDQASPALNSIPFPSALAANSMAAPLTTATFDGSTDSADSTGTTEMMFMLNHHYHEVLGDAFRLLRARRMVTDERLTSCHAKDMEDLYVWLRILTWTSPGQFGGGTEDESGSDTQRYRFADTQMSRNRKERSSSCAGSGTIYLTAEATTSLYQSTNPALAAGPDPPSEATLNANLLRIYAKLVSRCKSCLDGNPDPLNPYTRAYVPYCLQTPVLAQAAIYTTARFLHETRHVDNTVAVAYKGRAADMPNEQLLQDPSSGTAPASFTSTSTTSATSDDAITAAIQRIMDEWYRGQTESIQVQAHLDKLREMIRLRGGLRNLGMNGLISKFAVASSLSLYMSYEEPAPAPFRVAHNTPLVSKLPSFAQCAEPLKIHPTTASILDDMRFLISAVLGLPADPSAKELQKVQTTAEWIRNRIQRLSADSPEAGISQEDEDDDDLSDAMQVEPMFAVSSTRRPSFVLSQSPLGSNHVQRKTSSSPHLQPLTPPASDGNRHASTSHTSPPSPSHPSRCGSAQEVEREDTGSPAWFDQRHRVEVTPSPPASDSDPLYQAVRQTALIYARAVLQRKPLSEVVEPREFMQLWTTTWRVSLMAWKGLLGVFMWVTLAIVASARDTPRDLFVRSMLSICTVQMSLESWDVSVGAEGGAAVELLAGGWAYTGERQHKRKAETASREWPEWELATCHLKLGVLAI